MLLDGLPIAVDSFDHQEPGLFYFCSHAHEDHLDGLHGLWDRGVVYCSLITGRLLQLRWPQLSERLRPLSLETIHDLVPGDTVERLQVLLVDAHHVPGAVMFIFSGHFGTVLHTGDFRLHPEHLHLGALPPLRRGLSRIFLDNTFCHPLFQHPSREAAIEEACEAAVAKWPCVLYVCVYRLGKEQLLQALAKRLQTKVFVSPDRAKALLASGFSLDDDFVQEPCSATEIDVEHLWRLDCGGQLCSELQATASSRMASCLAAGHHFTRSSTGLTRSSGVAALMSLPTLTIAPSLNWSNFFPACLQHQ